jgi:hypothetical protein
MTYTQLFIRFLKHHNIYHLFIYNIKNRHYVRWCYDIKSLSTYKPYCFVDDAFIWKNTNEGFCFWSDINTKWRDILRNKLGHNTMALYNLNGNDII